MPWNTRAPLKKRKGWADAMEPALPPQTAGYSDVILYDATGKRIGVMDRVTRERRMDAA